MTSGDIGRLLWVSKGQQSLSRFQAHSAGPKASGCHCFLLFLPILHLPSPNPRPWACLEGPRPPLSRSLQGQAEPHPKGQVWRLLTCPAALARPGLRVGGAGPAPLHHPQLTAAPNCTFPLSPAVVQACRHQKGQTERLDKHKARPQGSLALPLHNQPSRPTQKNQ